MDDSPHYTSSSAADGQYLDDNAEQQQHNNNSSETMALSSSSSNNHNSNIDLVNDVWFRQHPQRPLPPRSSLSSQRTVSSVTLPSTIAPSPRPKTDEEWAVASSYRELEPTVLTTSYSPKTYPMAWVALFFLVLLRCAVAIFQNTFSPIPNVVANYLNVSLTGINWLYNVVSIVYIVVSFGTGWLYEVLGPKKTLIGAGIATAVGCWIRWVAVRIHPPSYAVMMVGQIIASIGNPLTLNVMTKFAAVWFTEDKRATAGMFVASNYGGIIAMFLMPAVATGEDRIEFTVIIVAVICTVALIPQFFIPAKPPTPPSFEIRQQSSSSSSDARLSVWQSTRILLKNVHFWILCGIHGLNVGLSIAWGGLTNQALSPYGYSDRESGNIVAVGIFAGTLGCLSAGPLLDATKRHNLFLKLMAPFMCSTYVAFIFIIGSNSLASILYVNALNQFFLAFMIPVVIELGVEATFPVPESISTSILWQIAQLIGFILVLIMDNFRDPNGDPPNNMFKALIFQAAIAAVCVVLCAIYRGPMKRTEAYRQAALEAVKLKQQEQQHNFSSLPSAKKQEDDDDTSSDRHNEKYHNNPSSRIPKYQESAETIQVIDNDIHSQADDLKQQ